MPTKTRRPSRPTTVTRASVTELSAKVAAARQRAAAARHQAESAKDEYKRVRKAFKLAKKAAKEARKRLKALKKALRLATHPVAKKASKPTKKPEGANAPFQPGSVKKAKPSARTKVKKARLPISSRKRAKPVATPIPFEPAGTASTAGSESMAVPVVMADVTISSPPPEVGESESASSQAPSTV